jgi:hypothetical protein
MFTSDTAFGGGDPSLGTTSFVARAAVSAGTICSGVGARSACATTLGKSWGPRPLGASWAPIALAASSILDPRGAGVPPGARALGQKGPCQALLKRKGKEKQASEQDNVPLLPSTVEPLSEKGWSRLVWQPS